ncbi:hypothetical protein M422DRAFT_31730 [Sphaerobolus stellatus SS14]|uniref:Unplaced genomic scaffold SPHSTscaffold_61, whole genome shotgun sequence n=1 Tax=Sphaerobolus stellatus (strain SS14) TaxID=990650 RepID=A0A0C9VTQ4_SPHS4|nr:hypothetical protein M422DRAFT_31730 [Sphaerobolus stellatus SS14]
MATPNGTSNGTTPAIPVLPNPFTPLAFLPPDIARETAVAGYVLVGTLGVIIWDILNNLVGDYKLLTKHRFGPATLTYFVSRIAALAYVLQSTVFETAPVGNCPKFEKILDAFYPVSVSTTALLFFFRIRAIFNRDKYVVSAFFVLWLCVVAGSLTVAFAVTGINIGPTNYCLNASLQPYAAAGGIVPLVHDTCVFLAISWKLYKNAYVDLNLKTGVRTVLYGEYLPIFSKALLQDGQLYYLVTLCSNLLTVIMVYVDSVPVTYRTMFSVPNIMITNIMAARVYRNTKFGLIRETQLSTTGRSTGDQRAGIPLYNRGMVRPGTSVATGTTVQDFEVHITTDVQHATDSDLKVSGKY